MEIWPTGAKSRTVSYGTLRRLGRTVSAPGLLMSSV
jgi:hypothetical protein